MTEEELADFNLFIFVNPPKTEQIKKYFNDESLTENPYYFKL